MALVVEGLLVLAEAVLVLTLGLAVLLLVARGLLTGVEVVG